MTILKADAADRRATLYTVLGLIALALIGGSWLYNEVNTINSLIASNQVLEAARKLKWLKFGLAAAAALSATAMALYLLRVARKTLAEQRFPPSGSRSLADMRVREGATARRIGQVLLGLSVPLVGLAVWLLVWGVQSAKALTAPPNAEELIQMIDLPRPSRGE
ncbi:MAG: hypothetical protein MUE46_06370 [Xanthomonadales bacterium]|jgi:hypothetical protein|nr:hypothetical protein [Xanthomonadales bacterium]